MRTIWETSVSHDHVLETIHLKVGEKESFMSQSTQDRDISTEGSEFQPGTASPDPDGFLYSLQS